MNNVCFRASLFDTSLLKINELLCGLQRCEFQGTKVRKIFVERVLRSWLGRATLECHSKSCHGILEIQFEATFCVTNESTLLVKDKYVTGQRTNGFLKGCGYSEVMP